MQVHCHDLRRCRPDARAGTGTKPEEPGSGRVFAGIVDRGTVAGGHASTGSDGPRELHSSRDDFRIDSRLPAFSPGQAAITGFLSCAGGGSGRERVSMPVSRYNPDFQQGTGDDARMIRSGVSGRKDSLDPGQSTGVTVPVKP